MSFFTDEENARIAAIVRRLLVYRAASERAEIAWTRAGQEMARARREGREVGSDVTFESLIDEAIRPK